MLFNAFRAAALVAVTVSMSTAAFAQERASREEAKAMVTAALAHVKAVGSEQAYKDFTDKSSAQWHKKDLYVFGYTYDLTVVAHGQNPKRVGKSGADIKDPNGKLFVREFVEMAKKGGGWVSYDWLTPDTKKVESKASYVQKVDGTDAFLGAGVYASK
jgi:signal transduction histidine kinase